jgi:transcriptional regulator with XRE-family HTH domain
MSQAERALRPDGSALERFGYELRRLRKSAGVSQAGLGVLVHVSADLIQKIEIGQRRPSLELARDCDSALGGEGALVTAWQRLAEVLGQDGKCAVSQGHSRGDEDAVFARGVCTVRDVEAIEDFTRAFRALDNKFGGGHAHSLATHYLDTTVAGMLRQGRYSDEVGKGLLHAAARLAHLAAWTAYDITDYGCATNYFGKAVELSVAVGDIAFGGEILAAKSHQAIHEGRLRAALELAIASENAGRASGTPALEAEACVLVANAQARMGDGKACAGALRQAERAFDRAGPQNTPDWLGYLDEGYLAARFAHCLRDLGAWDQARAFAFKAAGMSEALTRSRGFNMIILATAFVNSDLDQACHLGMEAVALAAQLQSGRMVRYIGDLRRSLAPDSSAPVVAEFMDYSREILGED